MIGTRKKKKNTGCTLKNSWPFDSCTNPVRGESAMWAAVITQALMDALSKARTTDSSYHKQEAIHWLTGNSNDFTTVCLLAGFDPDYVRKKAKRAIANPVPWRAEPGKGKRYHERREYRQRQLEKENNQFPSIYISEKECV
jgi:hypothetical protein